MLEDVDGFLRLMGRCAALGVSHVWVGPDPQDPAGWTERAAELLVPRLREV